MNHSNKSNQPIFDHSFSAFMLGLTLGALGIVLLGTQEGRDFARKTLSSLSDNLDIDPNFVKKMKSSIKPESKIPHLKDKTSINNSSQELPPPPPPVSHQPPRYFRSNIDGQLKGNL